ncbi:MAG: hypothetical protein HYY50_03310 [Candidatus Kerfeldbacteria bacterium]|nr:hypothetical protein [Candidatus Kerfeldbacteria bacterium]
MTASARLPEAIRIFLLGHFIHWGALALVDRMVANYPSVSDILLDRLPPLKLFLIGELYFAGLLIFYLWHFSRRQSQDLSYGLAVVGLFYALRGLFLLFLPIGGPHGAIPPTDRFVLWPFPSHAYFPGGHLGLMFLLGFLLRDRQGRRWFLIGAAIFGLGSLLTKAHYTADLLGGLLLGYGVFLYGERALRQRYAPVTPRSPSPVGGASQ